MHTVIHLALKLIFVLVIAVLFTFVVSIRPGGRRPGRTGTIGLLVVGAVIGVIFLTTQSLYEVQTAL